MNNTMPDLNIRLEVAKRYDFPEIRNLFSDSIRHVCAGDYTPAQLDAWTASVENVPKWISKIENQYFLVARSENTLAGFASLENDVVDLLYVSKDFQGKGVGKVLYVALEKEALVNQCNRLTTHASITASPFFQRMGFSVVTLRVPVVRGIELNNFEMMKILTPASGRVP